MDIPTHPEARLSIDQVAYLIDMEARTLRRWEKAGKFPRGRKIHGKKRWKLVVITEWLRDEEIRSEVDEKIRGTIEQRTGTNESDNQKATRREKKPD